MAGLNVEWNKKQNVRLVEGKPLVFHCHHYNCHLQKTIEDARIVDGTGIQVNAALETAYEHFTTAFQNHPELKTTSQRLSFAADFFRIAGFGTISFARMNEMGGTVTCPNSHYAKGWISKWGKRESPMSPVCHFNTGWIAGVAAAAYQKQRYHYEAREERCEAIRGKGCVFKVEVR